MLQTTRPVRSDYNKIANRGKLRKSGQGRIKGLPALQEWKNERYSFLQSQESQESQGTGVLGGVAAFTDRESNKGPDEERGHESSSSATRKEMPEPFTSLTSPPQICRTKKRTRDKDKEEKESHFNDLISVMKELVSHFVSQQASTSIHDRAWESFFMWLNDFTHRMPRTNWREFQQKTLAFSMEFTPAESPPPNPARPRIQSASSQPQQPMDPPPRPPGPSGTSYIDLLHTIPQQMVSTLLL